MKGNVLIWSGIIIIIIALYLSRKPIIKLVKKLMNREEFIQAYAPVVKNAAKNTGLYPSLFMAQAILESSDTKGIPGNSGLAKNHNNFFGIKKFPNDGWQGKTVNKMTREVLNGKEKVISQTFKKYDSPEQSFIDRVAFLKRNSNYRKAGVFTAKNPFEQAQALQRAGYATDPNYAKILSNLIEKYNLTTLDHNG